MRRTLVRQFLLSALHCEVCHASGYMIRLYCPAGLSFYDDTLLAECFLPGKKKLILSGFHEAALAAFAAAAYLQPEKQIPLQYTTTSPKLHKALGVSSPNIE